MKSTAFVLRSKPFFQRVYAFSLACRRFIEHTKPRGAVKPRLKAPASLDLDLDRACFHLLHLYTSHMPMAVRITWPGNFNIYSYRTLTVTFFLRLCCIGSSVGGAPVSTAVACRSACRRKTRLSSTCCSNKLIRYKYSLFRERSTSLYIFEHSTIESNR
jgi:hypothetical protein